MDNCGLSTAAPWMGHSLNEPSWQEVRWTGLPRSGRTLPGKAKLTRRRPAAYSSNAKSIGLLRGLIDLCGWEKRPASTPSCSPTCVLAQGVEPEPRV